METEQAEEHLLAVLAAARLGDETIRSEQFTNIAVPTVRFLQLPVPKHLLEGLPVGRCETGRL